MKGLEFEYECGTFKRTSNNSEEEKTISFLRATNVSEVVKQTVKELSNNGHLQHQSNVPDNVLWVLLTGDKGSRSTKLLLQVLNTREQHSIQAARLLAIFEGDKDNYECLNEVFKPVIDQVVEAASNIAKLKIKVNLTGVQEQPQYPHDECAENIQVKGAEGWSKEMLKLDPENHYSSSRCKLCRAGVCTAVKLPASAVEKIQLDHSYASLCTTATSYHQSCCTKTDDQPATSSPTKQENQGVDECWLSLGGDWEFIARLLGLTGPNGSHFCNFCLCKISNVVKGEPHTPTPLKKYEGLSSQPKQFQERTFESIYRNNQTFVADGSVKSKVSHYNNCQHSAIFKGKGPILDSVSCMPLHLSLGLGKQAVDLIEREAIKLDNSMKEANGEGTSALKDAMVVRKSYEVQITQLAEEVNLAQQELKTFLEETAPFHQEQGRRYSVKTFFT